MIVIGIIFLTLYLFFMLSLIGTLMDTNKKLELIVRRQTEIIRTLKK